VRSETRNDDSVKAVRSAVGSTTSPRFPAVATLFVRRIILWVKAPHLITRVDKVVRPLFAAPMRIIIAAVILATLAPLARADVETAKKAYEKGMTQYNLQKFNEALAMFQRAYEEKVDPAFSSTSRSASGSSGNTTPLRRAIAPI
jgi:hypothetical protein